MAANLLLQLREDTLESRMREMERSSRIVVYKKMQACFDEDIRMAFELMNYGLANLDDIADQGLTSPISMQSLQSIFTQSFEGEEALISSRPEQIVAELGYALRQLARHRFKKSRIGKYLFQEILQYFRVESQNLLRRGAVLGKDQLDKITLGVGRSVAAQFLYLLDPTLDRYELNQLANGYGFAVKLADNLLDFQEDVKNDFVNVPTEDMHHLQGVEVHGNRVFNVDERRLSLSEEYIQRELARIRELYTSTDGSFIRIALRRPIWHKGLPLARELAYSWFNQVKERYG